MRGHRWPRAVLVNRVQHQLDTVQREQRPPEMVARLRRADHLESQDVAIKVDRRRHVENFQQRREAPNISGHRKLAGRREGTSLMHVHLLRAGRWRELEEIAVDGLIELDDGKYGA